MSDMGQRLKKGLEDAIEFMKGDKSKGIEHIVLRGEVDVRKIRQKIGLTQEQFAALYSFNLRTLQHWEQGTRQPQGPAKVLLKLIQKDPKTIERLLRG
ncbi:MAG: transcriptional regulator [Legionellaceae bacterium]|nr:transcriptional regulator [Legionellaceae bacterium]|tara:strand:+ start:656 stop:949 length:294 start_codon:yes stop_codon:yes gene_type:complete